MKREFVVKIFENATDEQISAILNENGKDLEASKQALAEANDKLKTAETEVSGLKEQIKQRDSDIDGLQAKIDGNEAVTKELNDLKTKYEKDTATLQGQIESQRRARASEKLFDGYEFSSDYARKAVASEFDEQKFKLDEKTGEYVGGKEWLDKIKTDSPSAFKVEVDPTGNKGGTNPRFASGANGGKASPKLTLSELMKMKNENPNVEISFDNMG